MAKLGTYSYPDVRFGDAVEIAGRILNKFHGVVSVKGLAWELGMAENSGTLFAKIAALRDFGLVEGRGELRVSDLGRRIIIPANPEEARQTRIQAFQRVDLLRTLYDKFEGEAPDDSTLLISLEEITKASREDIVRRFALIQKHLRDAAGIMRGVSVEKTERVVTATVSEVEGDGVAVGAGSRLVVKGLELQITGSMTPGQAIDLIGRMSQLTEVGGAVD